MLKLTLLSVIMILLFTGCNDNKQNLITEEVETVQETTLEKEQILLSASWNYRYADIKEISEASDIVALVRVEGVNDTYTVSGVPMTEFNVQVITSVEGVKEGDKLVILQTGAETEKEIIEVSDDPLLKLKEEYLIFARDNKDGTVTILGGPQGRLIHINDTFSSIEYVNTRLKDSGDEMLMTFKVVNQNEDSLIKEIHKYLE